MKKTEEAKSSAKSADKGRRKPLMVVCSKGVHQRFLRGMITHDLVQRGLAMATPKLASSVYNHSVFNLVMNHVHIATRSFRVRRPGL